MKSPSVVAIALVCMLSGSQVIAQTSSSEPADNSKSNKSNAANAETADSQTNTPTDIDLTKRIRQSLIADKSLSTYAHNVKIVSVNGNVTLNGVVRSADEKSSVEMKAANIAGKNRVTDDLTIAPNN